jgi:hypothetical protein
MRARITIFNELWINYRNLKIITLNLCLYLFPIMAKRTLLLLLTIITGFTSIAQVNEKDELYLPKRTPEPFLFSKTTLTSSDIPWSLDYSASYGERVSGQFGFDGVGQQLGLKGYLGKKFTLYGQAAFGFDLEHNVTSAQQAEVIHDFIGGTKVQGFKLGAGLGIGRDFSSVISLLSRVTVSYDDINWKAGGNILFQKSFSANRDAVDIISSIGFHHRLYGSLYGGFETVGEDLEGFWDPQEAEGGAKLLVGPSLNMTTKDSKMSFSVSGGPVFYATQNQASNPDAIRELPSQNGLTLRAKVIFNLSR